ncbi:cilia- and flagella-associated protein 418 [Salarias fasciatus]|uniref:Cilia- and flagella-associated protein 418 n=1 Tax=Salarias fasciatus TaxID=181472 RepID=A0A672G9N5_SALFA|nr:protein C8orf37 homolog [Salarias fasciatus]XP_029958492.1 protein C8orf37 homolog [Salarias fasciatus]
MADDDDLDDLLDEVEKKFCRNVSVTSPAHVNSTGATKCEKKTDELEKLSGANVRHAVSSVSDDIDALLEELLEEDYGDSAHPKTKQCCEGRQVDKKLLSQPGGRKCCPVFIGGSSVSNGVGTATSQRSCDQLRCVSCDFRVLMFDDCEWDSSCDYLFLRNNMPDRQKLRSKLQRRTGLRAYACQCSWFSTLEPADLRDHPRLRWVCGRHQD